MRPRRPAWLNATAAVSILALLGIALAGTLLSRAGGGGDAAALVGYAQRTALPPAQLIVAGARTHRIVVLGDVPGSGAAKRVAAAAVDSMALGPGLDVLVLDVDSALQPAIDAYLEAPQEDAGILLSRPGAVPAANADDYLGIYRRVWQLNQRLGADRAIGILAGGVPGWPPVRALAPGTEAERFARLGPEMARRIEDGVFARNPGARVLAFVGGYQALKSGYGALSAGGGAPMNARWLAAVLDGAHPGDVYSVIQDGPPEGVRQGVFTGYGGTLAYAVFRDGAKVAAPFGLTVGDPFRFLRQPIVSATSPGLRLIIEPANYLLGDVVDGYIYLGPH